MIATITVTASHRGTGRAVLAYAGLHTGYEVERTHHRGVETVTTRVLSGALHTGDVGSALNELVAGAVRRGVGVERYDLRHADDGAIVAYAVEAVAA